MPFAIELLAALSLSEITLAMDGSTVGRNCICLMVSVIYKNRALPLAWFVIEGSKGHLPEIMHLDLIDQVHKIVPDNATVVFVGDGEFDGISLLKKIESFDWFYVCRTGKAITYYLNGEKRKVGELQHDISGNYVFVPTILFTSNKYPSSLVCCWEKCYKEPIFLVTNLSSAEEASRFYKRRFKIETFFSDEKSRGFNLHKSHLEDSIRISRLMIAACLAYIWVIYWGANSLATGLNKIIHRTNRCDLSLFQLGLRTLDYFLNRGIEIPVPTHSLLYSKATG
ncbi:MAG: transposase [Deltaproteobacteria bacterium]|nr:transposase [Deltaproteobacteria bacterium]